MKKIIFLLFTVLTYTRGTTQEANKLNHEIGVLAGFNITSITDKRFSNLEKKYIQPKLGLVISKWNTQRREEFLISYTTNTAVNNPKNIWYKVIHPEVNYTYQRRVSNMWIGGSFQSSTLLLFPNNGRRLYNNNPISYTIANSLGIAINRSISVLQNEDQKADIGFGFRSSLLTHLIRPAYAHPYPEHYLQEEVFSPTRSGLGKSIVKSGKLKTINKYYNMRLVIGFNYIHGNNVKFNFQYIINIENSNEAKALTQKNHNLIFGVSYLH